MRARWVYRHSLALCAGFALVNSVVAFRVWSLSRRPVEYNIRVIEPPNVAPLEPLDAPSVDRLPIRSPQGADVSPVSAPIPEFQPPRSYRLRYYAFVVDSRPCASMSGRYYYEGDRHAYGVIRSIFPERIYLEGGDYIENVINERGLYEPVSTGPIAISP